jgi:hypothetical protein
MDILYNSTNNICYNNTLGSIRIESINFENDFEEEIYEQYIVEWSGDLDNAIISTDGRLLTNLSNGIYSFKIISSVTNAETDTTSIEISSPPELQILKVRHSEYSCVDENGFIYVEINGGVAPYTYSISNSSTSSSETAIKIENLSSGDYTLSVTDSNGCLVNYDNPIIIKQALTDPVVVRTTAPTLLDSYAEIEIDIIGNGPFSMTFINNETHESIYIDALETTYILSIDINNDTYKYIINNLLTPGNYSVNIKNIAGCISIIDNLQIPNINPMRVFVNVGADTSSVFANYTTPLPIFDTFLLPYKFVESNSDLWQLIKNKKLKDEITILINNEEYHFKIVRNMLDKYCINDNKIEILRLGEKKEDWFYYFYIAPSINTLTNPEMLSSSFAIKTQNETHVLTLGLKNNNIDTDNPSLIVGSFILNGVGYNQFYNGGKICININEPEFITDCEFYVKNINKSIAQNTYQPGPVTILGFLDQFNVLNENINIGKFACDIDKEFYQYILNIKNLLKIINNFNNLGTYFIHNAAKETYTGSLSIGIIGNNFFIDSNQQEIINEYSINYYYFNNTSNNLLNLYKGSTLIINENNLENIENGFYIVRIKDKYSNIPKQLVINDQIISYDTHYIEAKKLIQINNSKILDQFLYGDILTYVDSIDQSIINNSNIPSSIVFDTSNLPSVSPITLPGEEITNIVNQSLDSTDTGSIDIRVSNANITNYIYGPNNYKKSFNTDTKFANLIPGVYTILGDENQLESNSLYQNETRIFVDKNSSYDILLNYFSYENKIIQRD